ncbi:hypothetical protein [Marinifilum caeruleilacunae]|uniref:Uncharacterized protein n=1 Tax=Marinifilum caeruleilacunae TaxID=2499076 RepID=A0ABX1X1P4_9BACT|nr:hypothetical protein [Marinifilum caeruleilacunae]NOU62003.1 hypothetical protein [Marinifilum caeruleilacunae]
MDKILSIILIIFAVITLGVVGTFYFSFGDHKELKKIKNPVHGEKIYLMKVSWGLDDCRMAIGLNRKFHGGFANDFDDKYLLDYGEHFFYKFSNDSLIIYGSEFDGPKLNEFKTPIVFISLENPAFIELGENETYKTKGLAVFPKSVIERFEYNDKRNKK